MQEKLPVWRLISGLAVLACLLLAGAVIVPVYFANYRFSQYVRTLASRGDIAGTSDDAMRAEIVGQARELNLPIQAGDVTIRRAGTKVQLQVARYKAQVWHADLHFPAIATK